MTPRAAVLPRHARKKFSASPATQLWWPVYSYGWEDRWGDELRALGAYPPGFPPLAASSDCVAALDLPDDVLERKYRALLAQRSQVGGLIAALTPDRYRSFLAEECFRLATTAPS